MFFFYFSKTVVPLATVCLAPPPRKLPCRMRPSYRRRLYAGFRGICAGSTNRVLVRMGTQPEGHHRHHGAQEGGGRVHVEASGPGDEPALQRGLVPNPLRGEHHRGHQGQVHDGRRAPQGDTECTSLASP